MNEIKRALERAAELGRRSVGEIYDYGDRQHAERAAHVYARELVFRLEKRGKATLQQQCPACRLGQAHSGCTDIYRLADGSRFTARAGMLM